MVCVACFKNEGLRLIAAQRTSAPTSICGRCGSRGAPLTSAELEDIAFDFFRNGSIPTRSQFGTERYRISDTQWPAAAKFRSSLAYDCDLLRTEANINVYEYEPSPLWRIGCGDIQLALHAGGEDTRTVLDELTSTVPIVILAAGTILYRVRVAPVLPEPAQFDPPPHPRSSFGRFDSASCEILYTGRNVETCLHEARVAIPDEITLATLRLTNDVRVADLTAFPDDVPPHESLRLLCSTFCLGGEQYYESCRQVAVALRSVGFGGFIYESYFSLIKPNSPTNVALFGRPLSSGMAEILSVNGLNLREVNYAYTYGPAPGDQMT